MKVPLSYNGAKAEQALIDSGATENFLSPQLVQELKIQTKTLRNPRTVINVDGTENIAGTIKQYCDLDI